MAGTPLVADVSGALFWEEEHLLVVSDLHLEKGSSFAARGVLLPPYDSAATLARLAGAIARYNPKRVMALGDSFHDRDAHTRLARADRHAIDALQAGRDWIWISGNHDPALPPDLGGAVLDELRLGPIAFRHEPTGARGEIAGHLHPKARVPTRGRSVEPVSYTHLDVYKRQRLARADRHAIDALQAGRDWIWISGNHDPALPPDLGGAVLDELRLGPIAFRHEPTGARGEIAGHLHPKARVPTRGRSVERRCFACDGERAVMPAFGAYAGGLSIRDRAFAAIFRSLEFTAHVLGDARLHAIAASRCY